MKLKLKSPIIIKWYKPKPHWSWHRLSHCSFRDKKKTICISKEKVFCLIEFYFETVLPLNYNSNWMGLLLKGLFEFAEVNYGTNGFQLIYGLTSINMCVNMKVMCRLASIINSIMLFEFECSSFTFIDNWHIFVVVQVLSKNWWLDDTRCDTRLLLWIWWGQCICSAIYFIQFIFHKCVSNPMLT